MASPQTSMQGDPGVGQAQPSSIVVQSAEQPSNGVALLSSHVSLPKMSPSAQIGAQLPGPPPTQVHPTSSWQLALHPSRATGVPVISSHVSLPTTIESPHTSVHTDGSLLSHVHPDST